MSPKQPRTIVLIHGLWMTPRSWEDWVAYCTARRYRVLAPAYPGLEAEVEALREDPSPIQALTIPDIVAHYEGVIGALDAPPILIGHAFGGLVVQLLLDRGRGAAGVAINSVPPEGVLLVPTAQIRSVLRALASPVSRQQPVTLSAKEFHYVFANTLSAEASVAVYERYHIPAPGPLLWSGVLANLTPGRDDCSVNFANAGRAPLLFIAGGADHIMPPRVSQTSADHHRASGAVTAYKEFPGRSHYICGERGWEEVAAYALNWVDQALGEPGATAKPGLRHLNEKK